MSAGSNPGRQPEPNAHPSRLWTKTSFTNLIRYGPSGVYFARVRVQGKLIRRSLNTSVLSVAKLRLSDFENLGMHLIPLTPSGCGLGFLAGSPTDQILARDGWQGERLPQEAVEQ